MDAVKTGLLIAQARKEKALTQKDVAQALHVSTQAVSNWPRGLSSPDPARRAPRAELLGLSISELVSGTRGPQPQEPLVRDTLRTLVLQMERGVRRWRRLFLAVLLLVLTLLFGGGYLYVRDNTSWLPQRMTVVTPRAATEGETLAARTAGGTTVGLFDLTVADDVTDFLVELELWTTEGLVQTWQLAKAENWTEGGQRRQTLVFSSRVDIAEPLSSMAWGVTLSSVGVWNGKLDDLPYMGAGYGYTALSEPAALSPDYGVVLMSWTLASTGTGRWRTGDWTGDVDAPTVEEGGAFLLLRLKCS